MKRRACRNHTPAFKAKVALAAVKNDRTIGQLAEQFDVHRDRLRPDRDDFDTNSVFTFARKRSSF